MDNTEKDRNNIEVAESIESKWRVDHVESGLPRWLIGTAFVCYLLQAAINWTPLMHWMEDHASWASAIIQTFGPVVMYVGLMRGMRRLYRPMTVGWWVIIVLNIAGFIPPAVPVANGGRAAAGRVADAGLSAPRLRHSLQLSRAAAAGRHLDGALHTDIEHHTRRVVLACRPQGWPPVTR